MPKPVGEGQKYLPGLDGLRAIAVAVVIAYHLGLGWASGGLLGVGIFFTLSGYLITDLLLEHWGQAGGLGLDDDQRRGKFGEDVELGVGRGVHPQPQQQHRQGHDDDAVLDGPVYDRLEHVRCRLSHAQTVGGAHPTGTALAPRP